MSENENTSLDEKEKEILEYQVDDVPHNKKPRTVFAYATTSDLIILAISIISAIIAGALNPLLTVIFGQLVDTFEDFSNGSSSSSKLRENISHFTLYFVYLGIAMFVFVYISTAGFFHTGERITRKLKRAYLEAVVRQNIAFFDVVGAGEVTNRISSEMDLVQEAISGKISLSLTAAASFSAAFIIAFVEYWKLAFILTSSLVVMLAVNIACTKLSVKYSRASLRSSSGAAAVADEAISSIRYATAFGLQDTLAEKYHGHLLKTEESSVKARFALAVTISTFMGVLSLSYGLAFWQGSRFLNSGEMSAGSVVTIVMATVIGSLAVGRVAPNTQAFMSGIAGASSILATIGRSSPQDPLSEEGIRLNAVKGEIVFRNVSLIYPSRDQVKVLKDFDLNFPAHKTTAIVGPSGSGKSSIVGLIERFYDPVQGQIFLDGFDIETLNLGWLRQQISLVGQEPILFSTSIFENIRQGLAGLCSDTSNEQLQDAVVGAAKKANAHDFILDLPRGYETEVGESGLQLSGGQRQRIAIARALIKDPKILILDEAMSALDAKAEQEVQVALEKAAIGRTTIIIAHRLSTIRGADNIAVIAGGGVAEQGSHPDLMARGGIYAQLVQKQEAVSAVRPHQEPFGSDSCHDDVDDLVESGGEKGQVMGLDGSGSEADINHQCREKSISKETSASKDEQVSLWTLTKLVGRFNKPEALTMALGLCCSVIAGIAVPVQAVLFAESIDRLSPPASLDGIAEHGIGFWSLMYLMLGIVVFATWLGQGFCFALSAERLIRRVRDFTFRTILRQDVLFFDEEPHSTGALTSLLSTSTTQLGGLSGAVLGTILTATATLGGGIILSLVIGWKLALICTATVPVILGCGWARLKMLALFETKVRKANTESASYATEIVKSIRTVASLSLENYVLAKYGTILELRAKESLRSVLQASIFYAASQAGVMLVAALGFWYGGNLIADKEYTLVQFFICQAALISGTQQVGAIFSFAPDMSKAAHAARDLKAIFDRRPGIDTWTASGKAIDRCRGRIDLKNVSFHYPSRDQWRVLDDINISVESGQYIALVGSSGCGKSTIISLLERFFDPVSGQILVDGKDITSLNINDYRRLISFVGQESTIYQGSIRENIVLGVDGEVSEASLVKACKEANIYDFVLSLPEGFSTIVGYGGSLLSGGQKQRLAIARALLRNTNILLLDEATSALDADSEKVVQQALDRAVKTRTTIAVAHRLSTVRNADAIFVLDEGSVVERGTHEELMRLKGKYWHLVEMQRIDIP